MLDILATLTGFVGILLLLSLVVTGIVQALQALGLREKSLKEGLQDLLDAIGISNVAAATSATEVLRAPESLGASKNLAAKKARTWITQEELLGILKRKGATDEQLKKALELFPRMEEASKESFTHRVRQITFACAFVVALLFQVSTPALLRRLSTDPELRSRADTVAREAHTLAESWMARDRAYVDSVPRVLEELAAAHPDQRDAIEDHGACGQNRTELIAEMQDALAALPAAARKPILDDFIARIDKAPGVTKPGNPADLLARVDIAAWGEGWSFYWREGTPDFSNILGVLATAILLTFGAPFWYDTLTVLLTVRDALRRRSEERGGSNEAKAAGVVVKAPAEPNESTVKEPNLNL